MTKYKTCTEHQCAHPRTKLNVLATHQTLWSLSKFCAVPWSSFRDVIDGPPKLMNIEALKIRILANIKARTFLLWPMARIQPQFVARSLGLGPSSKRNSNTFDGFKMCNTDDNSQIADQKQKLHLFIHVPNLLDKICWVFYVVSFPKKG